MWKLKQNNKSLCVLISFYQLNIFCLKQISMTTHNVHRTFFFTQHQHWCDLKVKILQHNYTLTVSKPVVLISLQWFNGALMPPSHCCKFCLRTNTNWYLLRIAQHCIDSNFFVLVRCHFHISSQVNTNVFKCLKRSHWPCESKPIRITTYCIAKRGINSCQSLLVRISSLYIRIYSSYIHTGIRRLSAATQYISIWCSTMALSYWIAHVRMGSCKFLLFRIVFSLHRSAIVSILHHHRTASYCIMSPSCCILLHLTASYQFVFNSCLIRIASQISIVSNRSGSA